MHGGDARSMGFTGGSKRHRTAIDGDDAAIRPVQAGHDLDKGRLAGAVFTEKRVNFAAADIEGYIIQYTDSGKGFRNAGELDYGIHAARPLQG